MIDVQNISKSYRNKLAVDRVTFQIFEGEILALVGESGAGKSTLGRCLLALEKPDGEIFYKGKNIYEFSRVELFHFRREVQMIYQDPTGALNPKMSLEEIMMEPLIIQGILSKQERSGYVKKLLDYVGLSHSYLNRYPYEFSGGQRQRIVIARALALKPKFIVCDEPLSALDVSIQAQIVNLLKDLQKEFNLTYLFISHDLALVRHISDRVAVMSQGAIVEIDQTEKVLADIQ